MSAPKHTPGPWAVESYGDRFEVVDEETLSITIARITGARAEATACLIAAAPDLLEALQDVLSAERFSNRPPETVEQAEAKLARIRAAAAKADAAIAKATGGQS